MSNKEIAVEYLRKGFSVIPLWSRKEIKRKPPHYFIKELNEELDKNKESEEPKSEDQIYQDYVTRICKRNMVGWKQFQERIPTEAEVTEWFTRWPEANIAIVTGPVSNLVVFDIDKDSAMKYAEGNGGFPSTPMVQTGKGFHVYVQMPDFEVGNTADTNLGLDIRGKGGYVAAPPSVHGSGRQYQWVEGASFKDILLAPCKPWMVKYLKENAVKDTRSKTLKEKPPKPSESAKIASTPTTKDQYADIIANGAQEGVRNHTATRLIGHYFAKGLADTEVWELVKNWNATKNNPQLSESELHATFESIRISHSKNDKPKEEKIIKIDDFLDTVGRVVTEYDEQYVRVPFAGSLLPNMQSKMNGGLVGGRTYVLGGIPSSGKTVLINNIADNICLNDHPVLFFSFDDGRAELRYRTYCRFSGFDIEAFNQQLIENSDVEAIFQNPNVSKISALKFVVIDIYKVDDWPKIVDQIIGRKGKAPVIIIDYLRKLKADEQSGDERLRVDGALSMLTELAKKYNLPILVISELARDSYKFGQRLSMASCKESGSIEYEASWLGILAAVEETDGGYTLKNDWERIINHDGNIDLIVFKAKRGTGATGKIALKLDKAKMTVRDRIEATRHDSVTPIIRTSKFD